MTHVLPLVRPRRSPRPWHQPTRGGRNQKRGFSLIEMMVAMTMLGIILLTLAKLSVIVSQRGRTNGIGAQRTAILQSEVNKFGAMPFATLSTFSTSNVTRTVGGFAYTRRLTRTATGTSRIALKIVIIPTADSTRKDSVTIDRIRTATSALCTGC